MKDHHTRLFVKMLRTTVLIGLLAFFTTCALNYEDATEAVQSLSGENLVEYVNGQETTWQAKAHPMFEGKSLEELRSFLGALKKPAHMRRRGIQATDVDPSELENIPVSFDSVQAWPQCSQVVGLIQDQSKCGSCWAVSTTSVMSDRLCIASNGKVQTHISAMDLMSCCNFCGYQCQGGWPDEAFYQFAYNGIVTGSNYTDDALCKPYLIRPCVTDPKTGKKDCPDEPTSNFACEKKCQTSYKAETYKNDHYFGKNVKYFAKQNDAAIVELLKNGPLVAAFNVYEDFYNYAGGIYQYTAGAYVGGHAVRIVGYGSENGTDYWKVANSWNTKWGEEGYFRIKRNTNSCGFESEITSAEADLSRSLENK